MHHIPLLFVLTVAAIFALVVSIRCDAK